MSLESIRARYNPQPADAQEELKRLRAENTQLKRDVMELLAEVDRLNTGKPPGEQIDSEKEAAEVEAQLSEAGLQDYIPRGPVTLSREAENLAANSELRASRLANGQLALTARGEQITAGFDPKL